MLSIVEYDVNENIDRIKPVSDMLVDALNEYISGTEGVSSVEMYQILLYFKQTIYSNLIDVLPDELKLMLLFSGLDIKLEEED